jgi:hypothetical protein
MRWQGTNRASSRIRSEEAVAALGREFRAERSLDENNLLYLGIWFVVVDQVPEEQEDAVMSVVVEK